MELLKKQPETEWEYFLAVEELGYYLQSTRHGLSRDHISDPDGKVAESLLAAQVLQTSLGQELSEKFGVILPRDCPQVAANEEMPPAPAGKIYYKDWYDKQRTELLRLEFEDCLCSACPFTHGVTGMRSEQLCKKDRRDIRFGPRRHACPLTTFSPLFTAEELEKKILRKAGKKGLARFQAKQETIILEQFGEKALAKFKLQKFH